jgi:hypothetical protein
MKKIIIPIFIVMTIAVLFPKGVFAVQSGGGYIVHDQLNPLSGTSSGGGLSAHTQGSPVSQKVSGNGYSVTNIVNPSGLQGSQPSQPPATSPNTSPVGGSGGALAVASSTTSLANSPDLNSLQGIIPKGSNGQGGSIYINSLTVNNGNGSDANKNLLDVSGETVPKTTPTTILYIIGAFVIGLILGAIVLELFELIIIRIVGTRKGKENV